MKDFRKCTSGTGKAKGFDGCGQLIPKTMYGKSNFKYGIGISCGCYKKWLYNTEEGLQVINNSVLRAKKKVAKDKRLQLKKEKLSIKKKSEFEKELQFEINSIVRLLDVDLGCISCDHGWTSEWTRQAHAGHYYSVGSDPTLRYNLFNIWKQCSICNNFKSGNERNYEIGIIHNYGNEMLENIKSLKSKYKSLHLSKDDLQDKIKIARRIKREILKGKTYTREEINNELNIYV